MYIYIYILIYSYIYIYIYRMHTYIWCEQVCCIWCVPTSFSSFHMFHIAGSPPWGRAQQPGHDLVMSALRLGQIGFPLDPMGQLGHMMVNFGCFHPKILDWGTTLDFLIWNLFVGIATGSTLHCGCKITPFLEWKLQPSVSVEISGYECYINGLSSPKSEKINNLNFDDSYEWQILVVNLDMAAVNSWIQFAVNIGSDCIFAWSTTCFPENQRTEIIWTCSTWYFFGF